MSFLASLKSHALLITLAGGVLASFTIFGYAQESLTRGDYGGERFKFPSALILLQASGNIICSVVCLLLSGEPLLNWSAGAPPKDWLIVSSAYLGAHEFGLWALAYIPFPLQVVCKSCKAVPVMLGETVLAGKKHSLEKKIQVLLMVAGVVAFTLAKGSKSGSSDDWALTPTLMLGLALVIGALVCDGIYGPYQNKITKNYGAKEFQLMFNMNLYEFVLALILCFFTGELVGAVSFVQRHPEVLSKMAYFGSTMALGSLFLFKMQATYGALTVTLTTTLRKLISVVFSVLWFGHQLSSIQWGAAFVVMMAHPIATQICKVVGPASATTAQKGKKSQ